MPIDGAKDVTELEVTTHGRGGAGQDLDEYGYVVHTRTWLGRTWVIRLSGSRPRPKQPSQPSRVTVRIDPILLAAALPPPAVTVPPSTRGPTPITGASASPPSDHAVPRRRSILVAVLVPFGLVLVPPEAVLVAGAASDVATEVASEARPAAGDASCPRAAGDASEAEGDACSCAKSVSGASASGSDASCPSAEGDACSCAA
eukprot:scaffold48256_cov48-Phaeocystis_antarctica.AAC.3